MSSTGEIESESEAEDETPIAVTQSSREEPNGVESMLRSLISQEQLESLNLEDFDISAVRQGILIQYIRSQKNTSASQKEQSISRIS